MSADALQFTVTPRIQEAYELLIAQLSKPQQTQANLAPLAQIHQSTAIPLSSIKLLSQKLQENGQDIWIHQLLRGSQLYVEPPKPKPRNPELIARLDKIKQELDEIEYQRMTANVAPIGKAPMLSAIPGIRYGQPASSAGIKHELREANKTISAIINILFSAVGVGFAVGYASYTLTADLAWRVLLALGAALVTVVAESWLFIFASSRGRNKRLC